MKTTINIDRLNLRLQGLTAQEAQQTLNGLGPALLRQLAENKELHAGNNGGNPATLSQVEAGVIKKSAGISTTRLQAGIVETLGKAVGTSVGTTVNIKGEGER